MVHTNLVNHEVGSNGPEKIDKRVEISVSYDPSENELDLLKELYSRETGPMGDEVKTLDDQKGLLIRFDSDEPLQWLYEKIRELQSNYPGYNEIFEVIEASTLLRYSRQKGSEPERSVGEKDLDKLSIFIDEMNISFMASDFEFILPTDVTTDEGEENLSKLAQLLGDGLEIDGG